MIAAAIMVGAFATTAAAQTPAWTLQTPASSPLARYGHVMAYDIARGVTVLFGGERANVNRSDTWEWNGTNWTQRLVSGPSDRSQPAMAYDGARGVCVLFGGSVQQSANGETWEWDGAAWTRRVVPGPAGRSSHAMAYDANRGVTVLFGGSTSDGGSLIPNGETWEWNGSSWAQRVLAGPSPRYYHAMAFDSVRGVTVLFGGQSPGSYSGETWEWNGVVWTPRPVNGPSPRANHVMAFDAARGKVVVFGGTDVATSYLDETWEWDGQEWTSVQSVAPDARISSAMAYDSQSQSCILFGGAAFRGNGVYSVDGETWEFEPPCIAPTISGQPSAASVCPSQAASFAIGVIGFAVATYQWQIEVAPGLWTSLTNTPAPVIFCSPSVPGFISASAPIAAQTEVNVTGCGGLQSWNIRCVVTNPCGESTSQPATLTICPADFNCADELTIQDIFDFLNAWFATTPTADFNGLNGVDIQDIFAFLNAWFAGC